MTCRHDRNWTTWRRPDGEIFKRRCERCQEHLPLGPANDLGEHAASVAVEVRAASLAARWIDSTIGDAKFAFSDIDDEETRGWSLAETNMQQHTNAWHAGYLARCIATHPDGGNE